MSEIILDVGAINKIIEGFSQVSIDPQHDVHPFIFVTAAMCYAYGLCRGDGAMKDEDIDDVLKKLSEFAKQYVRTYSAPDEPKAKAH